MNFETFIPQRRGRVGWETGPTVRLTTRTNTNGGGTLRISREALLLVGITPKKGDHHYFVVDVDREAGAIRLTPTEDTFTGRLMNPRNRQISLSRSFFEWTKWGDSRWSLELKDGGLYGDVQEPLTPASMDASEGSKE